MYLWQTLCRFYMYVYICLGERRLMFVVCMYSIVCVRFSVGVIYMCVYVYMWESPRRYTLSVCCTYVHICIYTYVYVEDTLQVLYVIINVYLWNPLCMLRMYVRTRIRERHFTFVVCMYIYIYVRHSVGVICVCMCIHVYVRESAHVHTLSVSLVRIHVCIWM